MPGESTGSSTTRPERRRRGAAWALAVLATAGGAVLLHEAFAARASSAALSGWAIAVAALWAAAGIALMMLTRTPAHEVTPLGHRRATTHTAAFAVGAAGASLLGATVLARVPALGDAIGDATATVDGARSVVIGVALVTGIAEELFFRVGLHRILPARFAPLLSTVVYAAVTCATGNIALVAVAAFLGAVAAIALQRTGRWYAPIAVHVLWTITMVGVYPMLG